MWLKKSPQTIFKAISLYVFLFIHVIYIYTYINYRGYFTPSITGSPGPHRKFYAPFSSYRSFGSRNLAREIQWLKTGMSKWLNTKPLTGWWLNQPIWKICSSAWESSPKIGVKIRNMWNHHLVKQYSLNYAILNKYVYVYIYIYTGYISTFDIIYTVNVWPPVKTPLSLCVVSGSHW